MDIEYTSYSFNSDFHLTTRHWNAVSLMLFLCCSFLIWLSFEGMRPSRVIWWWWSERNTRRKRDRDWPQTSLYRLSSYYSYACGQNHALIWIRQTPLGCRDTYLVPMLKPLYKIWEDVHNCMKFVCRTRIIITENFWVVLLKSFTKLHLLACLVCACRWIRIPFKTWLLLPQFLQIADRCTDGRMDSWTANGVLMPSL